MNRLMIGLLLAAALAAGCGQARPRLLDTDIQHQGEIRDLRTIPQDLRVFAVRAGAERRLLSASEQAARDERFNALFFRPWSAGQRASVKRADAYAELNGMRKRPGYAENLRPWTPERLAALERNAASSTYPSRADRAITVRSVSLRAAPTILPRFAHPFQPGQGYPFDLLQYSTLPPGMPLLLTHTSLDGAWAYAETALVSGWLPVGEVALVDAGQAAAYQSGRYAALLRDSVSLFDREGRFLTLAGIGALFPLAEGLPFAGPSPWVEDRAGGTSSLSGGGFQVWVPARDADGRMRLMISHLQAADAALKPLPLTAAQVARVGQVLLGQPYGWGGYLDNRDCSALIRDVMTPFGIWLPRNSAAQTKAWNQISLKNLSPRAKKEKILREGRPFATLLWMPGHITFYVGEDRGEPIIFHDMWGVRTEGDGVVSGRFIVGRAVLTTTTPGAELPDATTTLLDRMQALSILE